MKPVLVDTSVWVDHFRQHNTALVALLAVDLVLCHPLVIGEIACGTPPARSRTLADLGRLPLARQASLADVLAFLDRDQLFGQGCGFVDMSLLASTKLTSGAALWTLDRRLAAMAQRLGVLHQPAH